MKRSKLAASILCLSMTLMTSQLVHANEVSSKAIEEKLIGSDRYQTAIQVSKKGWQGASDAIIVNSSSIVDALSVTPYAKAINAPILLTDKYDLNYNTKVELQRLGVKTVHIIGLEGVVSETVNSQLRDMGIATERIGGQDRYKTALNIANKISEIKDVTEIAVVNGDTGLADAVSIASVAASRGTVILPASKKVGIVPFENFIQSKNIVRSYVIGLTQAIPNNIISNLPQVERIGGIDRNDTNAKVIERFYGSNTLNNIFVCKNDMKNEGKLIDALSVGVLASKEDSPVLIVGSQLGISQKNLLKNKKAKILTQVGSGGNENAFNEIRKLYGNNTSIDYSNKTMYVANTDKVNVRKGPSTDYKIVGSLKLGDAIKIIKMVDGWGEIKYNGSTAYVIGSYLTTTPPQNTTEKIKIKYVKSKDGLNVRKGPSTGDLIVGKLTYKTKVEQVEMSRTGWVKIKYNGSYAYVSNEYLSEKAL